MLKSGLILGGIMLVVGSAGGLLLPPFLCIPCLAVVAGLGAGYLAGQFDRPGPGAAAARTGAGAGAIGGVGALLAHLVAGAGNAYLLGPEAAVDLARALGLDTGSVDNPIAFYGGALAGACCVGLFEVALMAGLGALGGLLWGQIAGPKAAPPAAM
jgi:hypothetical protein